MATTYNYTQVKEMIREVLYLVPQEILDDRFELRLNDKGMNNNNAQNDDYYGEFEEEFIESFIY